MNDQTIEDATSAATPAALPEQTDGVNAEPSTSLATAPPQSSDHGASGERAAGRPEGSIADYLGGMMDDMKRLLETEKAGAFVDGYRRCLADVVEEHLGHDGLIVMDRDDFRALSDRPLLCRFCQQPLTAVERVMDDTCAEHARKGLD